MAPSRPLRSETGVRDLQNEVFLAGRPTEVGDDKLKRYWLLFQAGAVKPSDVHRRAAVLDLDGSGGSRSSVQRRNTETELAGAGPSHHSTHKAQINYHIIT